MILLHAVAVRRASQQWQEQSERLDGSRKNLAQARPELLGERVAPAAAAFLTLWERRVLDLREDAAGHSDALDQTILDLLVTDQESVQRTQRLLMWSDRDTDPTTAVPR